MARFPRTLGDVLAAQASTSRDMGTSALSVPELAQIQAENLAPNIIGFDQLHPEVKTDLDDNKAQLDSLNVQLDTELPALQTALATNTVKVNEAKADVAQAQIDIATATSQAVDAQTTADGKGRIWYQTTAPTPPRPQDLWFDTTAGPGKYLPKRYDTATSTWVSSTDKIAADANTAAVAAQQGASTADAKAVAAQAKADQATTDAANAKASGDAAGVAAAAADVKAVAAKAKADQATIDAANAKTIGDAAAAAGATADAKAVAAQTKANKAEADAAVAKSAGDAAAAAASVADGKAVAAQNKANQATTDAANAKAAGDAAAAAAATADAKGVAAQTAANNAATAASAAQTSANTAATAAATADAKGVAAQTAANTADGKAVAAQTAANTAATAAATADGKAVAAQTAATTADGKAVAAQTAATAASTLANKIVKTDTAAATGTPPSVGALWNQTNADGSLIIKTWTANAAGTAWVERKLDDAVIGNLNAATINAGIINAARLQATDIRTLFLTAGKVTASDIVAGTLTSASGVFGTIDASVINAGTINVARLAAADIRTKFLAAGTINASEITAGTLTSASGVFGTIDASIINAGTINSARLVAGDIRAKFLAAGTINASEITAGTLTSASGVFGTIDASVINAGTINAARYNAADIRSKFITAGKITAADITAGSLTSASGIFGTIDASAINAGTINVARLNAGDIRSKFIEAGTISASEITTGTLTSASGVFGTIDASIINAGTINAARLNATDIRSKFITAGKITAADITAGTLTSASGIFGTIDASVINAGTLNAARLDAGDVRAKFIAAGKIVASELVAGTLTSASGVFGTVDASVLNAGTLNADRIAANTITASKLTISDLSNFAPSMAESPDDWSLSGGMAIVGTSIDTSGKRLDSNGTITGTQWARGPFMAVKPGESLYATSIVYRSTSPTAGTGGVYLRYEWYDGNKAALTSPVYTGSPQSTSSASGTKLELTAVVPAGAAYARMALPMTTTAGNIGYHSIWGRRMNGGELVVDGSITSTSIATNAITAGHVSAGAITADKIAVNSITADKVLISKGGNLLPDTQFVDVGSSTGWSPATYVTHDGAGTSGYSGGGSMLVSSSATQAGSYYAPNDATRRPKIVPGSSYRVSVWVRPAASAPAGSFGLYLKAYNDVDNTSVFATSPGGNNATTFASAVWARHTVTFTIPEGNYHSASVGLFVQAAFASSVRFSDPSLQQAAGGELIVDGAILAKHIKADEITATQIKAGTITATEIAANAVTATQLAANAVTATKVLAGSIGTNHMTANSINADRLVANSITADKILANSIGADQIAASSISAQHLVVSDTSNLHTDPKFDKGFLNMNGWVFSQALNSGKGAASITPSVAGTTYAPQTPKIPVMENTYMYFALDVAVTGGAVPNFNLRVYCYDKDNTNVNMGVPLDVNPAGANSEDWNNKANSTYQTVEGKLLIPAGTQTISFRPSFYSQAATGEKLYITNAKILRASSAELIVDGSITADKLESDLVLATKIIAGDPARTHTEMSSAGFRVFARDPAETNPAVLPTEVIRLGVDATDDYFAVADSAGKAVATIDQYGKMSGTDVYANNTLYYKGDEMQTLLDALPRGIVAAAYRDTSSTVNSNPPTNIPFLRLEANLEPGRIYKIWTSPMKISRDAGASVTVGILYNKSGLATLASNNLTSQVVWDEQNGAIVQELFALINEPAKTVSFLIWLGSVGGQAGFRPTAAAPIRLVIEDVGPNNNSIGNGVHMNGTVTPPAAVNSYVKTYSATNSMNYQGSNAQYVYDTARMYQGLSPAGYGNLKSIATFGDMTADLSGATVNRIRVYFNFDHWYYNSGGTARIGVHGFTSVPSTFSQSVAAAATSSGWPKPGARWIDLPSSVFAGFKSGSYRGVSLEGDSSYTTYGYADRPKIEISYTK